MAETIQISLPDGSCREVAAGTSVLEVAKTIGSRLARQAVAGEVDGELVDLSTKLERDQTLRIITTRDPEAESVIRHSAEHVLADAVKRLWPGTPIDAGRQDHSVKFQYDFRFGRPFQPEDLAKIEEEMVRIIKQDLPFVRNEVSHDEAGKIMKERGETIKLVRLADIPADDVITLFSNGDFVDLCRGPHVQRTSQIGAVRLLEASGAYFKGDERNEMLQRIYGTAFASKKALDAHFARLEEIKRRDHRRLGPQLQLFTFFPEAPASPFFLPRGTIIYNALLELMRTKYRKYGYQEVITPQIFDVSLWQRSGHWDNYRDDMFFADAFDSVEERSSSVKPMNCPSHCLIYGGRAHSYRELPIRIADFGRLHRYERSGVVTGLTRVRTFSQDDGHIYCTPDQMAAEITTLFDFIFEIYELFGFEDVHIFLSTEPSNAMGDPKMWRHAEEVLASCLDARDVGYTVNPGDGAFYGPKIDFVVNDALGREWQLATIQLDFQMPERFDLNYVAPDGTEQRPVMIHRAILGSIERFIGVMIEHYAGDLPPWLAPEQVRVLPITDAINPYACAVRDELVASGIRAEVDQRSEKLNYKIREGETTKVPYLLVVGQREADNDTVSLRLRHRRDMGVQPRSEVLERIINAVKTYAAQP